MEESNDAYTYKEGHPFHALGRNISDDLRQERSIETNYEDILHGDVIMESQLHSNSGEWNNSKLENYADVFIFFTQTKLFMYMAVFMLLILSGIVVAEALM